MFLWLSSIIIGPIIGKKVIHKWLLCKKLKSKLFTKEGQGSWMIMLFTTLLSLYVFSFIYNLFLRTAKYPTKPWTLDSNLHVGNHNFKKFAAICTGLGDFMTAWIVTDMVLQVPQLILIFILHFYSSFSSDFTLNYFRIVSIGHTHVIRNVATHLLKIFNFMCLATQRKIFEFQLLLILFHFLRSYSFLKW